MSGSVDDRLAAKRKEQTTKCGGALQCNGINLSNRGKGVLRLIIFFFCFANLVFQLLC